MTAIPIFTFVNDSASYAEMLRSFSDAGFTDARATFTQLGPPDEPYSTITRLISEISEPYFILCHQDVRADQGHRIDDLIHAIEELDIHDPLWAVAGNAGGLRNLRVVRCITDPHGGRTHHRLPASVHSLDENFLLIKSRTDVGCSPELSGFHLYGPDVCLNALAAGRRAYVVDFHLSHLSAGRRDESYYAARDQFVTHWRRYFWARYVRTTVEVLFLSRWPVLRHSFGHPRLRKILKNHFVVARVFGAALSLGTRSRMRTQRSFAQPAARGPSS